MPPASLLTCVHSPGLSAALVQRALGERGVLGRGRGSGSGAAKGLPEPSAGSPCCPGAARRPRHEEWGLEGPPSCPPAPCPETPSHPVLSPSAFLGVTPAPSSRASPQQPGRFRPLHGASRAGLGEVGSPGTQFRRGLTVPLREPGDRTQTLPRGSRVGAEGMIWGPSTRSNSEPLVPKSGKSSVEWH